MIIEMHACQYYEDSLTWICFFLVCVFFGGIVPWDSSPLKHHLGECLFYFFQSLKQIQVCPDTQWGSSIYLCVGSLTVNVGIYTIHWAFGLLFLLIKSDTIDLIDFKTMDS